MSQVSSIAVIIAFMVGLSLILNFIGNTILEIVHTIFYKMNKRKSHLNNCEDDQYDSH